MGMFIDTSALPFDKIAMSRRIRDDRALTVIEKAVLFSAVSWADEYGQIRATQKVLAESVAITRKELVEVLDSQRVSEYLEKEKSDRTRSVAYFLQRTAR